MKKLKRLAISLATILSVSLFSSPAYSVTSGIIPPSDTVADSVVKVGVGSSNCSGVMISPSWALTAKHCVYLPVIGKLDKIAPVQVGIFRDNGNYSATVHAHETSDIALLNINGVHDGAFARLPSYVADNGEVGKVVGFGGSGKNIEVAGELDVVLAKKYKSNRYSDTQEKSTYLELEISKNGGNLMKGDSGGPFFIGNEVHGVFSHGPYDNEEEVFSSGGFSSTAEVLEWIHQTTGISGKDKNTLDNPTSTNAGKGKTQDWEYNYSNPEITDNGPSNNAGSRLSSEAIGSSANLVGSSESILYSLFYGNAENKNKADNVYPNK